MGFGLVILRLRTVSSSSLGLGWLLGFVFAMVGLLTVVIATCRYFSLASDSRVIATNLLKSG
ncbi:MAG UNVERIFIED_CONTAM: hypothetical protein LVR29_21540 [Microcystis novacekii LVE1205-3]